MFSSMLYLQPSVCRCLTHNRNPNINCSERTKGHVTQSVCFGSSAEARLNDPNAFGEVSRTSIWVVGCDKRWWYCWVQCLWKWWLRSPKLCSVSFPGIVFICQSEDVDQCESSHGPDTRSCPWPGFGFKILLVPHGSSLLHEKGDTEINRSPTPGRPEGLSAFVTFNLRVQLFSRYSRPRIGLCVPGLASWQLYKLGEVV